MSPESTHGPRWVNVVTQLSAVVDQGAAMFDRVHTRRGESFGPHGQGFHDFGNYAWQAGKRSGAVPALKRLKDMRRTARAEANTAIYGRDVRETDAVRDEAALWYRRRA
jgi:hypothetical protein